MSSVSNAFLSEQEVMIRESARRVAAPCSIEAASVNAVTRLGIATSSVKNACTAFHVVLIAGSVYWW